MLLARVMYCSSRTATPPDSYPCWLHGRYARIARRDVARSLAAMKATQALQDRD
jgi:hypothetical protein